MFVNCKLLLHYCFNHYSDVSWLHNYPGHASLAHDDIYAHANTRSAIVDLTSPLSQNANLSCGQYSATCQNSAIFSQDFCSMKNVLASTTSAGDLIIHVGLNSAGRRGATFKNDKVLQITFVYKALLWLGFHKKLNF